MEALPAKSIKLDKGKMMTGKYDFSVDRTLSIKSWGSNMERLSHRPAESVLGIKINKIFPLLHDKIALAFRSGRKSRIKNFKNNCFMGTDFSADVQVIPLRDKKKKVDEVFVLLSNISGNCPLIKKLSDYEKMVAVGKVASSIAHGIRNPLNAIKGAVVYLSEKYGHEPTLIEFSTIINDEIDKLDGFISNFLSASSRDTKSSRVNLNDILKSIVAMIKPRAEIQGVRISHNFSVLPVMHADPFQIEHALFNIINNAFEAMPDGGTLNIKTSLKWENNIDYIVAEISDTGKGIPEEEMRGLGELSDNPERNDKGFGIFLSREVVRSHKGKLLWESARDRGTTFKILLPVENSGQSE